MAVCEGRVFSPTSCRPEGGGELQPAFPAVMVLPQPPSLQPTSQKEIVIEDEEEETKPQFDIWTSIQESKKVAASADDLPAPYVHPLLRRSSSMLSQKSMDVCTESLGSETGSDDYYCKLADYHDSDDEGTEVDDEEDIDLEGEEDYFCEYYSLSGKRKELASVNYHCSVGKKSPTRAFPPPLPSISRRDGPCLHMKPQRKNGRLVVQAVPVPSQNYLHCQREEGRLLLTFIEPAFEDIYPEEVRDYPTDQEMEAYELLCEEYNEDVDEEEEEIEYGEEIGDEGEMDDIIEDIVGMEEEAEEEEVEVLDRGTVVEVKVSRQPQLQSGSGKVHRSSLVINKFVVGTPAATDVSAAAAAIEGGLVKHELPTKEDTVAPPTATVESRGEAAVVAVEVDGWGTGRRSPLRSRASSGEDSRLVLFTTKKLMNREALLHQVRRCSYQHRPLFIWEPRCIATS